MGKLQWKGLVIFLPLLLALYMLYPTFAWYRLSQFVMRRPGRIAGVH